MCGITGFVQFTAKNGDVFEYKKNLENMAKTLSHRGPDEQGYFLDETGGIANLRLSILDLKTGKQPIFDKTGQTGVVFNGEIYNFQSLRKELIELGHSFNTKSDTEVVLRAYQQYGFDCVNKFNGMWAFAVYDRQKKLLFLSRDRFGKKPLYYSVQSNGLFLFGSEIKAIRQHPAVQCDIDLQSLYFYLTFGYIPQPLTIYKEIKKLPGGHNLVFSFDAESPRIWQYYDPAKALFDKMKDKTEDELKQDIRNHLERSVKIRQIADVPIGAFLSGGVDSSAVVAAMRKNQPESELHTFSIGFHEKNYDETPYAKIAADLFHTNHHIAYLDHRTIFEILQKLPYYFDEPFADSSMVPTYALSELASKYVKVALSGDGGDELFGGYGNYVFWRFLNVAGKIFRPSVSKLAKPFIDFTRNNFVPFEKFSKWNLALSALSPLPKDSWHRFSMISSFGVMQDAKFHQLFKPYFRFPHWLDNLTYAYLNTHLIDDFFVKVDRASMANSLEVRCPYLDYEFAEYALRIPGNLKIRATMKGWEKKYIFKKALHGYLPDTILTRKKHGFTMPVNEFLLKNHKPYLLEKINALFRRNLLPFGEKFFNELLYEHEAGHRDYGQFFYALLFLELWIEKWSSQKRGIPDQVLRE